MYFPFPHQIKIVSGKNTCTWSMLCVCVCVYSLCPEIRARLRKTEQSWAHTTTTKIKSAIEKGDMYCKATWNVHGHGRQSTTKRIDAILAECENVLAGRKKRAWVDSRGVTFMVHCTARRRAEFNYSSKGSRGRLQISRPNGRFQVVCPFVVYSVPTMHPFPSALPGQLQLQLQSKNNRPANTNRKPLTANRGSSVTTLTLEQYIIPSS